MAPTLPTGALLATALLTVCVTNRTWDQPEIRRDLTVTRGDSSLVLRGPEIDAIQQSTELYLKGMVVPEGDLRPEDQCLYTRRGVRCELSRGRLSTDAGVQDVLVVTVGMDPASCGSDQMFADTEISYIFSTKAELIARMPGSAFGLEVLPPAGDLDASTPGDAGPPQPPP